MMLARCAAVCHHWAVNVDFSSSMYLTCRVMNPAITFSCQCQSCQLYLSVAWILQVDTLLELGTGWHLCPASIVCWAVCWSLPLFLTINVPKCPRHLQLAFPSAVGGRDICHQLSLKQSTSGFWWTGWGNVCLLSVLILIVYSFQVTMGSSKSDLQSVVNNALSDFVQEHIPSASLE